MTLVDPICTQMLLGRIERAASNSNGNLRP